MNLADIMILLLIALAVALALRSRCRARKNGSSCCSGCTGETCPHCTEKKDQQ